MDIHNVFLNGDISEIVYMVQPPRFNDLSIPQITKAVYDLKQAPRA